MNEIKERIGTLSEELFGNNFSEFGRQVDFSDTSIKNYIKGKSLPGYELVFNICFKLGISPNWLILGIGEKKLPETINQVNGNGNTVGYQKIGSNNSNITQVMHSNDVLHTENEALKRENVLLREMLEIYKSNDKK